jgi:MalT-like TPR region
MVRRATYFAREGEFELARQVCHDLRKQYAGSPQLTLTSWLCLLEGITLFHEKPDSDAFDRIRRSYHLSRSLSNTEVSVWATAWLSHVEFNRGRLIESAELCSEALNAAQKGQFGPLSRVALTLADTFNYCGNWDQAYEWYSRARHQALSDGDRIALSAVLHNIAALRIHSLRLSRFCGLAAPARTEWTKMELDSSRNYDLGIGILSLSSLEPVLRGQLLILDGNFQGALEVLDAVAPNLEGSGLNRYRALLFADRLYCQFKLGLVENLELAADSIIGLLERGVDHDDSAIAFGVMSELYKLANDTAESERFRVLMNSEIAAYRDEVGRLRSRISQLDLSADKWANLYRVI